MKGINGAVLIIICTISTAVSVERRKCKHYIKDVAVTVTALPTDYADSQYADDELSESFEPVEEGQNYCSLKEDYCFSVFTVDSNGTSTLERQGCWAALDDRQRESCNQSQCVGPNIGKMHKFCCCSVDYCNENITMEAVEQGPEVSASASHPTYPEVISLWEVPAFYVSFIMLGILLIFSVAYAACRPESRPMPELSPLTPSGPGYSSNMYNVDNLKLVAMIGRGKYGSVWKGIVNEQPVAVKLFSAHNKQYFINEKEILSLPFMDNPTLLSYFGCDERRTLDGSFEYLLVLSLAPMGCLQDYLFHNTCSFTTFCKMAQSISRGLSHLHAEVKHDGLIKPCICHRDLNTRNILVKADLSCCICDFGFAIKTFGSRYEFRGELVSAEIRSLSEVGTIRYMAPEILEGAVNLRDCETSLKQIDVYSLGLVLWELSTRCHDWYPADQQVPAYKAPYETELGPHPTFELMQVLVSKKKSRPLFPPSWGGGAAAKLTRETCEDCWDNDAEARLTSRCVEERIYEISMMRPQTRVTPSNKDSLAPQTPSFITTSPNARENVSVLGPLPESVETLNGYIKNHSFLGVSQSQQGQNNVYPSQILVHSSLKDDTKLESEVLDISRGLEAVAKQNVSADKKFKGWSGVRAIIEKKLLKKSESDEKCNLVDDLVVRVESSPAKNVIVNLRNAQVSSTIDTGYVARPSNLDISPMNVPNRTYSDSFRSGFGDNAAFVVQTQTPRIVVSRSTNAMKSLGVSSTSLDDGIIETQLKRQRSLEIYNEIFAPSKERLRDPSQRVKTPGDVPRSVREKRVRATKTLSLYDDRMMNTSNQLL